MKIAFIFPGQGSQYIGMGQDIYNNVPEAKNVFDTANQKLDLDLTNICFNGPEEELKKTSITQPAILATSIACLKLLIREGVKPDMTAGHSLGEYSALVAAGVIDFSDAISLVQKRGTFMEEAAPHGCGGMAAILGLEKSKVDDACRKASDTGIVEVANYNCPGQVVISGELKALEKAMNICKELGAKRAIPLTVSGPFHSSLMSLAESKLANELNLINYKEPIIPVVANVSANYVNTEANIREALIKQISHSVRWDETIERMIKDGAGIFVEVGPGKVLSGLVKKINKDVHVLNVENIESLEKVLAKLKEVL